MLWFVKILEVNGNDLLIAYSCEESKECDGIIEYNTVTKEAKLIKESSSSYGSLTNKLIVLIPYAYGKGVITESINNITIG